MGIVLRGSARRLPDCLRGWCRGESVSKWNGCDFYIARYRVNEISYDKMTENSPRLLGLSICLEFNGKRVRSWTIVGGR